ncbi:MAG: GNAT family N-acetyltransferase [Silicimonas sp.]|nr:GNAT family N-acetyltransferase [Silicimonas sp.]
MPSHDQILAAVDATWPAAQYLAKGPWTLREGLGGGQRVSAASAFCDVKDADIDMAISGMRDLGQHPLFMIRPQDKELDQLLEKRGFTIKDPVTAHVAPLADLIGDVPTVAVTPSWPPLAVQREIWASTGIGPARIKVMERVQSAKTTHLGRAGDVPAGTAFTGIDSDLAMLHALEVLPEQKRQGVGKHIMTSAANWAAAQGARWLSVLVVNSNASANAFYKNIGMRDAGFGYHYRRAPEVAE